MDFDSEVTIKKELLSFEEEVDSILNYDLDINVKVENGPAYDLDYIQDGDILKSPEFYIHTTSYDELLKDSKQTCFVCCKFFPNSFYLLQHNLEHFKVPLVRRKLYMCDYCPKYYMYKQEIERHIIVDHTSHIQRRTGKITQSLHTCIICDKTMNYKRWHEHMKEVHSAQKFECRLCQAQFKCQRYLKRHTLYVHEGLRASWRFHTKPLQQVGDSHKCGICSAILCSSFALATHIRNCHDGQKSQCRLCGKIFKCEAYLSTHINRVHYDDGAVHSCFICGKVFKSPRYLTIHKRNSHKVGLLVSKSNKSKSSSSSAKSVETFEE